MRLLLRSTFAIFGFALDTVSAQSNMRLLLRSTFRIFVKTMRPLAGDPLRRARSGRRLAGAKLKYTDMNSKYALPKDGGLIVDSAPSDIIRRYEKIPASVFEHESEGVGYVADLIVRAIKKHNEYSLSNEIFEDVQPFVLGLTTGRTPLGLYHELVRRYRDGMVSFSNVAVYSLDEFYPIGADEPQSRNYRIHEEFLNHIDILPENIHIPDGTVPESRISRYCESYDRAINHIDLMIIGVGEQGQLGFNEPGSYEKSRTRLVQLSHDSRKIQSSAFSGIDDTPKMAITMGIDTIMRADKIVLMAWGEEKADVIRKVVEGQITDQVPATALQERF